MCNNLKRFEKFLADNILHTQTVKLQKLTKGGSSLNFRAKTEEGVYVIKLLLKHGANPLQRDREGLTPLEVARKFNHPDIVRCLEPVSKHTDL